MAIYQCARFFNNPFLVHRHAVRHIAKYLASMSKYVYLPDIKQLLTTCGVFYRPDMEKIIDCYIYSDFYGGWAQSDADNA